MKTPTSWTSQEVMRKCPRRFEYRYRKDDPTGNLKSLRRLMSVRELAGHVIHMEMADVIRRIADGGRISDQDHAPTSALAAFDLIVAQSRHTNPGVLHGAIQVAEIFNGFSCSPEIGDWRDKIPVAIENGLRVAQYLNFRGNRDNYCLEAEQRNSFFHRGKERRFVIDVLLREGINTSVFDWKTHAITKTDRQQVTLYQHYLLKSQRIPPTRLYGFVVDLLREEVVEQHYRAINDTFVDNPQSERPSVSDLSARSALRALADDYPTRPSLEACGICPFASICPDSAVTISAGLVPTLTNGSPL